MHRMTFNAVLFFRLYMGPILAFSTSLQGSITEKNVFSMNNLSTIDVVL